ncbi:MAG: 16S rRNA (uracil(1498)-N(3))-methyltransferase [Chitinophagaceae bacterium]|nr:16S rRNA (uracil(1498)-N(3))-methyltransferase [Chitinophagaceae bacterium]
MSSLPYFYYPDTLTPNSPCTLPLDTAKHIVQVLRMKAGDELLLDNGKGQSAKAIITNAGKKTCEVSLGDVVMHPQNPYALHLAIAFTRNTSRNEWLLEKATELGVASITPLITARTIREKYREDRWQNILVSAMLQSQQYYLPQLHTAQKLETFLKTDNSSSQKLIAHCETDFTKTAIKQGMQAKQNTIILIGPEGDFSPEEIQLAYDHHYTGIQICTQRLRTETAAMAVCAYFNLLNNEATF